MNQVRHQKPIPLKALLIILFLLLFIYFYPRFLLHFFEPHSPWVSYLYLYGFGFVFFIFGVILALKTGACVPGRGRDSFWLKGLFLGFIFLASLHAFWIYLALTSPFKGGS
ncbi:MAG: hypothetical protein D6797_05525 [Bdellovibrio sp.]|nr:MAG: hypothetical protein D6797_05525 [Bdellovibrio sp.]